MFDENIIKQVWEKGIIVDGVSAEMYRKDAAGAWIAFDSYGKKNSKYGWEIDHVWPQAKGGGDDIINLRPLHWKNNISKGDDYPLYFIEVKSNEFDNIQVHETRTVNEKLQKILGEMYG